MKIEVGKTYRSRNGEEVYIESCDEHDRWPFNGDNGCAYQENGRYLDDVTMYDDDLVEEVESEAQENFTADLPLSVDTPTQAMKEFADHCERAAAALERIKDALK